ncbi:T3SS (YopN, CesT) and YbjN peptide-binding chaperone 1 [Nocardioides korecus]
MSETFEESVERAWGRFEADLGDRVRAAADAQVADSRAAGARATDVQPVTVSAESAGECEPHLRLALWDDEIALEVGTDVFLADDDDLDEVQRAGLLALGWSAPDGVDHPTWWCDVEIGELDAVLSLVTSTLRGVFDVVDPAFLDVAPRPVPAAVAEEDHDDLVLGFPTTTGELAALVTQVLEGAYGDGIARDADGDFPIWTGTVPVWITAMGPRRALRFFSHVVIEVGNPAQARIEVEILNRRTPLLKFHLAGDVLIASYELPASPFIGPTVMGTLDEIADILDDLAQDLADRVGGRLFFDAVHESHETHEAHEDDGA